MANFKWNSNKDDKNLPLVVVLMVSRNKDNKDLEGFTQRKSATLRRYNVEKLKKDFDNFVRDGVDGEFCRLYVSVNKRDEEKVKKALMHRLVEGHEVDLGNLQAIVAALAAKAENKADKRWLFDFDSEDEEKLKEFVADVDKSVTPVVHKTPHGYAVLTYGFDCRKLMEKWGHMCELKKDDLLCMEWKRNVKEK